MLAYLCSRMCVHGSLAAWSVGNDAGGSAQEELHLTYRASVARDAEPRDDSARVRHHAVCTSPLREILENWLAGEPICDEYLIVEQGALAGAGAQSYTSAT